MTIKDTIQDFFEDPVILVLVLLSILSYACFLVNSSYLKGLYKSKFFKEFVVFFFITCLFALSFGGTTASFLDRWTRYGGTLTSFATNIALSSFCLFLFEKIGLTNINVFIRTITQNPLLIALSLAVTLSVLSSSTPFIGFTASVGYFLTLFLSSLIARKYTWLELEKILRIGLSIVCLLTLLFAALSPSTYFTNEPWGGLIGGRKNLGILCSLITSLWALYWINSPKFSLLFPLSISFFLIFVIFGNSITGIITLIACLYSLFLTSSSRFLKRKDAQVILTILGPISIVMVLVFISNFPQIALFFGKDPTFTGRTLIWEILVEKVNTHNPLLGYGYNGFWQIWRGNDNPGYNLKPDPMGDYVAPHAHNGFMEVFVQLGYFGFAIYMILFLFVAYRAAQNAFAAKGIEQRLPLLLIVFLITSNIGETFQLGMIGPNINLFLLVVLYIKLGNQRKKKPVYLSNPYLMPR